MEGVGLESQNGSSRRHDEKLSVEKAADLGPSHFGVFYLSDAAGMQSSS